MPWPAVAGGGVISAEHVRGVDLTLDGAEFGPGHAGVPAGPGLAAVPQRKNETPPLIARFPKWTCALRDGALEPE